MFCRPRCIVAGDMRVVIRGGKVVTGDGTTVLDRGAVIIESGRIVGVERRWDEHGEADVRVVDARDHVVMPGLVNCHAHGVVPGPLFSSAAPGLAQGAWLHNLDRHLLSGTTTVLNVSGFATAGQAEEASRAHPVNVATTTSHTPSAVRAALRSDGRGLRHEHLRTTAEQMLEAGAVAIGELAGGHTVGGGGQDVLYIPSAIARATGVRITAHDAHQIKEAAVGHQLHTDGYDPMAMSEVLRKAGLEQALTADAARDLVIRSVMPSVAPAIESIREGASLSALFGVPAIMHITAAIQGVAREVAAQFLPLGAKLVASNSNHPTLAAGEAAALAAELASAGCTIEAATCDALWGRALVPTRESWDRLTATPGLVHILGTDYGLDGRHDPLIAGVADLVWREVATLPVAVAMASSRVATAIEGLAPERGHLAPGLVADITIARCDDLCSVRDVFVGGRQVVRDGEITDGPRSARRGFAPELVAERA
jgi:imidazolonepropionase-like amidohydrolase